MLAPVVGVLAERVRTVLLGSALTFVTIGALDVITIDLAIGRFDGTASTAAWMMATLGAGGICGAAVGECYLAIAAGVAQMVQHGTVVGTVSAGDGVGEIALLRNVARTAGVRAETTVHAIAVGKEDFLIAVTGHPATAAAADTIISGHGVEPS